MQIRKKSATRFIFAAGIGVVLAATTVILASTVDFESLVTSTSVNGQAGWTVEDEFGNGPVIVFDEEVVDDGTGNIAWRFSNAEAKTSFSDQPYSQLAPLPAGETGSALWNDRGADHTMPLSPPLPRAFAATKFFHGAFRFRSTTGAPQADLTLNVSPSAKQSAWRNSFVSITDNGATGFNIGFFETGTEAAPFSGSTIIVASDLPYSAWHTIHIYIEFVDGANPDTTGNDCVTIIVNGAVVFQGTTWESFYRGSNPAGLAAPDQPHVQAVDSLMFRSSGTDRPGNTGTGLFFDDVVVDNAPGPIACNCGNDMIDDDEDCDTSMDDACPGRCDPLQCVCPQIGACCSDGAGVASECIEVTEDECLRSGPDGGLFLGEGTLCADVVDCVPLLVTMDSMSAQQVSNGVVVRWSTLVESDTAGFRIMRQTGDGREKRLETLPGFIPSSGASFGGASYEFLDKATEAGSAHAYFVLDVDDFGRETIHGPILVNRIGRQAPRGRAVR